MKGARKYAQMFDTGQYGKLYLTSGRHARGYTFKIQILPEGVEATPNGENYCLNKDAVEVYGVKGGNPGWTEWYGWLHKGPWQEDFERLVRSKEMELKAQEDQRKAINEEKAKKERKRIKSLLDAY